MKLLFTLLALLLPLSCYPQTVDFVSEDYWRVVTPDTSFNHRTEREALQRATNLMLAGVPDSSISIYPYRMRVRADNLQLAGQLGHYWVANFQWSLITPPTDSGAYDLKFMGNSPAETVRITTNCWGPEGNERRSTSANNPGDDSFTMRISNLECTGILTYWVTATKGGSEVIMPYFIDVGHVLALPQ